MPAKVHRGDAVPGVTERGGQEAIGGTEITHAGDEHDEAAVSVNVVCDPAVGAGEVARGVELGSGVCTHEATVHSRKANVNSRGTDEEPGAGQ